LDVESLPRNNSHPLQKAWIAHNVPQCCYRQSGQLMSATASA
jgi:isoquinoline 1-oxidoreductase alpha subunit